MGLPRNRGENSEILGGGVSPKCSGFLVKSTFQTPLGDLSRISGSYHFLKRSVYGNKTHPRPECVMGKLFCFRWFKTEKSKRESFGGIKEGSEWPKASAPSVLPEKRETHTPHHCVFMRKFSLVTLSGKHLPQLVSTIFFHIQVSKLQGNWVVYTQPPCTGLRTSTDLKHNLLH